MLIQDKVDAVYIPDSPSRIKATDYNQIKNEIQASITEAGLTPTKDVIQLPQALRILTQQSGAEERALIEQAGAEQVANVNNAGSTQVSAVNTAGSSAIQTAESWANKTDGPVTGELYSAKYWALQSKVSIPLLTTIWSDHLLDNISWLRADTFSWQSGDVYTAAYQELLAEYNHADGVSETDGDIVFKRTPKGYKICAASEQDKVAALYTSTGVAWYYILDTVNTRFKLPRTKWGFTGLRTSAGDYVSPGLPNITGAHSSTFMNEPANAEASGAFTVGELYSTNRGRDNEGFTNMTTMHFDASRSSSIYGNSNTVQPPATQMYLYFYVGNFTQEAIEQTAGVTSEILNQKIDLPSGKNQADVDVVVESYNDNNGSWYRQYKSGWLEQGGLKPANDYTFTLIRPFANEHYYFNLICQRTSNTGGSYQFYRTKTNTSVTTLLHDEYGIWYACGQGAVNNE